MFFLGDTHGNHNYIEYVIKTKKITNQTLIHVGDFGAGATSLKNEMKRFDSLNTFLNASNNVLHVFRGNHDDPKYFNGDFIFSNLRLEEDYTVIECEGKRILGVGGAVSIDRELNRGDEFKFWEDEGFVIDEEKINGIKDVDILVTHTTTHFATPYVDTHMISEIDCWPNIVKHFIGDDPTLPKDLVDERYEVTRLFNLLKLNNNITKHFYGHYHRSNFQQYDECDHICLDIGEFYEVVDYSDYENYLTGLFDE